MDCEAQKCGQFVVLLALLGDSINKKLNVMLQFDLSCNAWVFFLELAPYSHCRGTVNGPQCTEDGLHS